MYNQSAMGCELENCTESGSFLDLLQDQSDYRFGSVAIMFIREEKFFPTKQDGHARGVQKLPLIYREIFKYGAKQHALFDPPEGWEGRLFLPIFVEFLRSFSCTLPRRCNGLWWYCIRLPRLHAGQALSLPRSDSKIQNFPCLSLFIRSDTSNPTSTLLASSSLDDT